MNCWMICALIEGIIILIMVLMPYARSFMYAKKKTFDQCLSEQAKQIFESKMTEIVNKI